MVFRVGISGWTYPGWRGDFYPAGLAHRKELGYAAERLTSIEINGSFYSLQRPSSYQRWREETPDDFVFSVKGGRFITHMKRLAGIEAPLANFFASGVLALGPKLGPMLWQLPETLTWDEDLLTGFFTQLPRSTAEAARLAATHDGRLSGDRVHTETAADRPLHHALEVRSHTFRTQGFYDLLAEHRIACVVADTAGRWPLIEVDTGEVAYARLHGDAELYSSGYGKTALRQWAERCRAWADAGKDVYVYFDNDAKGFAPHDAMALLALLT